MFVYVTVPEVLFFKSSTSTGIPECEFNSSRVSEEDGRESSILGYALGVT